MQILPATTVPDAKSGPVLRDIHLPPDPSWWPPAPGWWLLALLALILIYLAVRWWRQRWRVVRARRQVLAELVQLRRRHRADNDDASLAADLHQLLRRVAREHDPAATRQRADAWRATLARVPVDAVTLRQLLLLEQAMYRPDAGFDATRALAAVDAWLRLALRPGKWKRAHA